MVIISNYQVTWHETGFKPCIIHCTSLVRAHRVARNRSAAFPNVTHYVDNGMPKPGQMFAPTLGKYLNGERLDKTASKSA